MYQLGEWEMVSISSEPEKFTLRLWTLSSLLELEVGSWVSESLLRHMLMLNLRKLMNYKLKEIGISNNSLQEWWLVNLQLNVEVWEAEVSKALNLQ